MNTLVVQMSGRAWTEKALHMACAMARSYSGSVVLVRMMRAQYPGWLGTEFAYQPLSPDESAAVWAYKAIAQNYGVELDIQPMQYATFVGALLDVAGALGASAVFADVPHSLVPGWRRYQIWDLRRQLERRDCALYTLDQLVQSVQIPSLETLNRHA
jgi:hypothetical protein